LTSKWWISSKAVVWNFTKNKLLNLVNLMKICFSLAGLNLNTVVQEKTPDNAHFMDDVLKTKGIKYLNVET